MKELKISPTNLKKNGKQIEFLKVKFKDIYFKCLYPCQRPTCCAVWEQIFDGIFNWKAIFKTHLSILQSNKKIDFHWKTIHRSIYTEARLAKMKKSNGKCTICKETVETTIHLLHECSIIREIWTKIEKLIQNILGIKVYLDAKIVIFGVTHDDEPAFKAALNLIILEAKWQIWKHRNNIKYGGQEAKNSTMLVDMIKRNCKAEICLVLQKLKNKKISNKITDLKQMFTKLEKEL